MFVKVRLLLLYHNVRVHFDLASLKILFQCMYCAVGLEHSGYLTQFCALCIDLWQIVLVDSESDFVAALSEVNRVSYHRLDSVGNLLSVLGLLI